ncbi:MAG TPA: enoyl-CoA hydratase/isomerase family protein [Segeticoccus sp.]|uniref:enoyl-CoA hydratase/isomerase family protein n=1 Tax=Segeticoccus sp. TaxID=2706531 RepID=UPI002D802CD2|nr:enoyl-CoA hydratase/isomerase family protein [Segeticoccus sp.]HET8602222.1 enoyl-CoA hydratase/isomerase family protein [Segeticoccus sp.]
MPDNLPGDRLHPSLRVERSGGVLTVTLDDPAHHNPQTPSLWAALEQAAAGVDGDVRVVVLRGSGPSFSAGLDRRMFSPEGVPGERSLPALAGEAPEVIEAEIARFQRAFAVWLEVPAVVVAAVQGHAIGAGFQLALAADLRVVAEDVAFAMREPHLGLVPDLGGTARLVRLVGYARALEICATGRSVGVAEAVASGLAQAAVPGEELQAATRDLCAAILETPAPVLRELKPLLQQAAEGPEEVQRRREREAQARLLRHLAR